MRKYPKTDEDEIAKASGAPRVESCIADVMARFPSDNSVRYFEAVHQDLAPLARALEREVAQLTAERDALQGQLNALAMSMMCDNGNDPGKIA